MSRFLSEEGLKVFWKKIKDTFLEKKIIPLCRKWKLLSTILTDGSERKQQALSNRIQILFEGR